MIFHERGLWGSMAGLVGRRARMVWVVTALVLAGSALFSTQLEVVRADEGVASAQLFTAGPPTAPPTVVDGNVLVQAVPFAELGFAVAIGVLLDTLIVRSLLVPALVHELDDRVWWPLPLRRSTAEPDLAAASPP